MIRVPTRALEMPPTAELGSSGGSSVKKSSEIAGRPLLIIS